jgi:osmotically inducible protein OsmC
MPIAVRQAEITWDGPLASGAGTLSSQSGALELPVTWAARTERPDGETSPEELIAAAHASCFAMALALVLGENHTPPQRLTVNTACTLDEVDGAPRITTIELTVRAQLPRLEQTTSRTVSGGRPLSARSQTRWVQTCRSACKASSSSTNHRSSTLPPPTVVVR